MHNINQDVCAVRKCLNPEINFYFLINKINAAFKRQLEPVTLRPKRSVISMELHPASTIIYNDVFPY